MTGNGYDILLRSLDDPLSADERQRLDRLLAASPAARTEMERLHALRGLVAAHGAGGFPPFFADRLLRRVASERAAGRSRPARRPALRSWGMALAAACVLAAAVGLAQLLRPSDAAAPPGATRTVTLADGSTVHLSSGSRIRFAGRAERRVRLEGEAFFDVAHGGAPFVVETFNARVQVHGTRFNVRAWPDGLRETVVTLERGRVAVAPRRSEATAVLLAPGQATTVAGDTAAARRPAPARLDRALAWRSGGLAFSDQPLETVFAELERRFAVRIGVEADEILRRRLTYLEPTPDSAAEVLSDICHTLKLRFRRTAAGFEVVEGGAEGGRAGEGEKVGG